MFLSGFLQHFSVRFIRVIDVGGSGYWQDLGYHVDNSPNVRPVGLAEIPSPTSFPSVDWTNDGVVISDGWCCKRENLSRIRWTGSSSCPVNLTNARSGLVLVFQRPEMKEEGSFGSKRSTASAEENHSARNLPSLVECLYSQLVCQLLKLPAYTAGARESGNEHRSSLLGGGL